MRRLTLAAAAALTLIGAVPVASATEEPPHTVDAVDGDFEIRTYAPMIMAEVAVSGPRDRAINAGFRVLADFIFGNNTVKAEIAMTAPVTQSASAEIAMTAPVTQSGSGDLWTVGFVMPAEYTMATLPKPNDPRVIIREVPAHRVAVLRFSWTGGESRVERKTAELQAMLTAKGLVASGPPMSAFYDPPWTPPFMRRNEIIIPLANAAAAVR